MRRGSAPPGRGTAAIALAWMGAALVFLLLQVVVFAVGGVVWMALAAFLHASGRAASAAANVVALLLEVVLAVVVVRRTGRAARLAAGVSGALHERVDDGAADRALTKFEWGMLGASGVVALTSIMLHGARPGWAIAVGLVDVLGAFLLLVGAVAATAHDREWHVRAYLAVLLLAASGAWTLAHG